MRNKTSVRPKWLAVGVMSCLLLIGMCVLVCWSAMVPMGRFYWYGVGSGWSQDVMTNGDMIWEEVVLLLSINPPELRGAEEFKMVRVDQQQIVGQAFVNGYRLGRLLHRPFE